jgi:hypothetical protein
MDSEFSHFQKVGRCRWTLSNPGGTLKAPGSERFKLKYG